MPPLGKRSTETGTPGNIKPHRVLPGNSFGGAQAIDSPEIQDA